MPFLFLFGRMARRLTTSEVCDLIFGDSDGEMECEATNYDYKEDEYIDEDDTFILEEGGEDLIDETTETDEHMAESNDAMEDEDDDIDSRPEQLSSETTTSEEISQPDDIPGSDEEDFHHKWCKNLRGYPMKPDFQATPGLQGPLDLPPWEDCKPIDFFRLFISHEQIKKMKEQTNLYARQVIDKVRRSSSSVSARSHISKWKGVKLHEIYNFLAIIFHMSVVHKPRIRDYWAKRSYLQTTFASRIMKRERFFSILAFFHLNDDSLAVRKGEPGYDPLHKLRPLVDHLNHAFQTTYIPEQHISIDEAMCPWRGRLSFKVYMKDKPVKWGIKLYELCESKSGYVWRFEILCGMPGLSNRPYDVVQRLIEPLKSLGYCLYTDSYYTSLPLVEDLASCNTGFTGTMVSNRVGLPKDFMNKKMAKGEVDFRRLKNTMVLRWVDKKEVTVLSTIHKPQMVSVKNHNGVKRKPTTVVEYNRHMGGVDLSDQMVSYNPFHRKTVKWWKKLAFHLLTLTMVQAHCLYRKVRKGIGKPGMGLEDFIISVGEALVTMQTSDEEQPTGAAVPQEPQQLRLHGSHFLIPLKSRKYCHVCFERLKAEGKDPKYRKDRTQRTNWECEQCKKALCVHPCMKIYHTMQDYTRPLQN